MEATYYEIHDTGTAQPREALRRARIDLQAAQEDLKAARFTQAQIERGVQVVHESKPDVAKAEAALARANERVAELEQVIAEIDAEAAEREQAKREQAAKAHAEAVKLADAELLAARREADRALLARLDAAGAKGNDKTYSAAIAEHRAAAERVAVALAIREELEEDSDE